MKHRESARRRLGFFFADITSLSHSLCVEIQEAQKKQLNSWPHTLPSTVKLVEFTLFGMLVYNHSDFAHLLNKPMSPSKTGDCSKLFIVEKVQIPKKTLGLRT